MQKNKRKIEIFTTVASRIKLKGVPMVKPSRIHDIIGKKTVKKIDIINKYKNIWLKILEYLNKGNDINLNDRKTSVFLVSKLNSIY